LATERIPCVWLWNVVVHLTAGLRMGSAKDLDTARVDFKAAWENLKARTSKDELAAAYKALNIRDDDDDKSPDDKERSCAANLRLFRVIQELPAWP